MNVFQKAWAWIKAFNWSYFKTFEPSMLRGLWVAVLAFATSIGVSIPAKWDAKVTAAIAFLVVVVPILQALWTRAAVVPLARNDAMVEAALYTDPPGTVPDVPHADVVDPSVPTPVDPPPEQAVQDPEAAVDLPPTP